jgi:hypothetical protein
MWWQTPRDFNDPFDCLPPVVFGDGPARRRQYAREMIGRQLRGQPRFRRRLERRRIENLDSRAVVEMAEKRFSEIAITCFSTLNDDLLMWSHYADNHRGVCLAFDQVYGDPPFLAFPVEYSDNRPVADVTKMVDGENTFLRAAILSKAKCWEYESEYRMFDLNQGSGYRTFPKEALTGVILGARIDAENKAFVLDLIKQFRRDMPAYQARLDETHFTLNIGSI